MVSFNTLFTDYISIILLFDKELTLEPFKFQPTVLQFLESSENTLEAPEVLIYAITEDNYVVQTDQHIWK